MEFDKNINIAGIDEAGRGPLAGPVIAAAVILDPKRPISGLADSKLLTESKREALYERIITDCMAYGVGRAEPSEIDQINIHYASLLAMRRAVEALPFDPDECLVDGKFIPEVAVKAQAIIKGDQKVAAISAASIIAKVTRDREMLENDKIYPGYGFAQHKGYPTQQHVRALAELGVCPIHRRSFKPVQESLIPV